MKRLRSWPADPERASESLRAELGPAWCVSYAGNNGHFRAVRGRPTGSSSVEATDPAALFAAIEAYFDFEPDRGTPEPSETPPLWTHG
ncbi:hypothetical protein [Actinoplanes sp. GCM10030250]|uniref:hypothetical protein n=1 Tax=Actinoplanes sp. GCM10030250 TaxID=3273376 RepID=UPI0036214554